MKLPWIFWDREIIIPIAQQIGIPIRIDQNTINAEFGHYARLLIDIDLFKGLRDHLLVDCDGHLIKVGLIYERLPPFSSHCVMVGHATGA